MTEIHQTLTATAKSSLDHFQAVSQRLLSGGEQIGLLNLAVAKATVAEALEHTQSLLAVRDPQQLIAMQVGMMQPMAEKSASYLRQMVEIMSNTNAEIGKLAEGQLQETQQTLMAMMDTAMKNAPAGSEAAVALFRNAFNATQDAIGTAQNAARQAVSTTEQNASAMSEQALSAVRSTSARSKR